MRVNLTARRIGLIPATGPQGKLGLGTAVIAAVLLAALLLGNEPSGATAAEPSQARGLRAQKLKGTAVLESRRMTGEGILLDCDGRVLVIGPQTRIVAADAKSKEVPTVESLAPGAFVRYVGQVRPDGTVQLTELSSWVNGLESEESKLYDTFDPEMLLPPKGEKLAILRVGRNRYAVVDDRAVQLYIDRLGSRLLPEYLRDPGVAARFGHTFSFVVASHDDAQASAFPNGVVVVHSGLFRLTETEAQLAYVVAHEIAHAVQKHAWQEALYHRGKLRALRWSTAGAGYIVESAIRRGYQRNLEDQADRLALAYMIRAGFDPRESLSFLKILEKTRQYMSGLFWDTHRSYGQRRKALSEEIALHQAHGGAEQELSTDSPEFQALRLRIPAAKLGSHRGN